MSHFHSDSTKVILYLNKILEKNIPPAAFLWVQEKRNLWLNEFNRSSFYLSFGVVPRQVGKEFIKVTSQDSEEASLLRPGLDPSHWTADILTRTIFMLCIPSLSTEAYLQILHDLFDTADVGELQALYASFPLSPFPEEIEPKCAEGIRTNITSVFERIAFHNPYPSEYLNQDSWNQMVIKTLFIGKNINDIYGLDSRRNIELSRIAKDLAHERWAAGRLVRPELWRLGVPFINLNWMDDINRLLSSNLPFENEAGALLSLQSQFGEAISLLERHYLDLRNQINEEHLTWETLANKYLFSV